MLFSYLEKIKLLLNQDLFCRPLSTAHLVLCNIMEVANEVLEIPFKCSTFKLWQKFERRIDSPFSICSVLYFR